MSKHSLFWRILLLMMAGAALLAGMWAGLLRIGWELDKGAVYSGHRPYGCRK